MPYTILHRCYHRYKVYILVKYPSAKHISVLYSVRWKSQINSWIFYASILRFPSTTWVLYLAGNILYVFGDFLALWMPNRG